VGQAGSVRRPRKALHPSAALKGWGEPQGLSRVCRGESVPKHTTRSGGQQCPAAVCKAKRRKTPLKIVGADINDIVAHSAALANLDRESPYRSNFQGSLAP
jgi:hypothetical protein